MKFKMPKILKRKRVVIAAVLVLLLPVLVFAGLKTWQARYPDKDSEVTYSSLEEVCAGEKRSDSSCHADYLENITKEHGPRAAFEQLETAYEKIPAVKTHCHPLTHIIGRSAAESHDEVAEAYAHGSNFCWSGYYHGVMEELISRFGAEEVLVRADNICNAVAEDKYSFYHYNCVHGLGHGFMLITTNELFESLEMCDVLSDNWERQSCYGGVYMENVMAFSGGQTGHSTEYLNKEEPMYPCTEVEDKYKQQCYLMQTSHALTVVGRDFAKVFGLCGQVDSAYVNTCYKSLGRDASGSTVSDVQRTKDICMLGTNEEARRYCIEGAVKDFISYHHNDEEALALCDSLEASLRDNCRETAVGYYKSF